MTSTASVTVIIPTYNRDTAAFSVLKRIQACDPRPSEIVVHIDLSDGILENELARTFPNVAVLTSHERLGPGGGRHRCLVACNSPYAVSFDDDSYPIDLDFFLRVENLFSQHPQAAIIGASIWHRNEVAKARSNRFVLTPNYVGCGHAIRVAAYRQVRGYLPRAVSYEMEESDLSLQLFAAGWHIYETGELRVFHDTTLEHHKSAEITSGIFTNIGLRVFLHYPIHGWGRGIAQILNKILYCVREGRLRGIMSGIVHIPSACYRNRHHRKPIHWHVMRKFFQFCRTGVLE
jgi:GT2 family glycosyltransferase